MSATSTAVDSGDAQDHLSHNSRKRQNKIDAQAAEITTVKAELNKALKENKKDILGHSISRCLKLYRQGVTAPAGMWCQWDAEARYLLLLL